jgi:hypothetical protein
LARPALTIIGHYFLKHWEPKKEKFLRTRKKTQSKLKKMILDVNAILLVEKKKKKKKSIVTTRRSKRYLQPKRGILVRLLKP